MLNWSAISSNPWLIDEQYKNNCVADRYNQVEYRQSPGEIIHLHLIEINQKIIAHGARKNHCLIWSFLVIFQAEVAAGKLKSHLKKN